MRRVQLVLGFVVVIPLGFAFTSQGCGPGEPPVEDLCGWLTDPKNCYRKFSDDVGARCGQPGRGNAPKGNFLARGMLDVCILGAQTGGGQVVFDPPLDVTQFPVKSASFKFLQGSDGSECGSGSFSVAADGSNVFTFTPPGGGNAECAPASLPGKSSFSIPVNAYPPDGGAVDAGATGEPVVGGKFSSTPMAERDVFDISCPGGETHHFNRLHACYCQDKIAGAFPRAEIESNAGGVDIPGFVRFRVAYPSADAMAENVVEYFDCAVPPAPKPCFNGMQDGLETDVDCGGGNTECARCADDLKCVDHTDCISCLCGYDQGFKKCLPTLPDGGVPDPAPCNTGGGGAGGGMP